MNSIDKSSSSYKVMLIDDTEVDAFISKRMLKTSQFSNDIMEFNSAQKALDFLLENSTNSLVLPQIILLDIHMPAMDGFDFMEKFKLLPQSLFQSCKVVMLSSSIDPIDIHRIKEDKQILKFLNKPLTIDQLQALNLVMSETIN